MRISIGKSRKDTHWSVKEYTWDALCERLSQTVKTYETANEYKAMSKDAKSSVKDIGGFVGGVVENGRRLAARQRGNRRTWREQTVFPVTTTASGETSATVAAICASPASCPNGRSAGYPESWQLKK